MNEQKYTSNITPVNVGDIVLHRSRGITGRIARITSDPESRVFISPEDGIEYDMSMALATTALAKLHPDSLAARAFSDRASVRELEKSAPLRLVALSLRDLGGSGRPSEIRDRLEGNRLLSSKWEGWWKGVKDDSRFWSYFRVRRDGVYELLSRPDEVPEGLLSSLPKKKESALSSSQISDLLTRLLIGELSFENVGGANTKHRVARELVKRARKEAKARGVIDGMLLGLAPSWQVVVQEVVKRDDVSEVDKALGVVLKHIADSALMTGVPVGREAPTDLVGMLRQLETNLKTALSRRDFSALESMPGIAGKLCGLATALNNDPRTASRTKAVDWVIRSLGRIAVAQPLLVARIGRDIAMGSRTTEACVAVACGMSEAIPLEYRAQHSRDLVAGMLEYSVDSADRFVRRFSTQGSHIQWWLDNFKEATQAQGSRIDAAVPALLEKIGATISSQELGKYVELLVLVILIRPNAVLLDGAQGRVSQWSKGVDLSGPDSRTMGLAPLVLAVKARLRAEQESWDEGKKSLLSDISSLENKLIGQSETIARLKGVIEELKSGFHTPERWVEHGAKRAVLERLGALCQRIIEVSDRDRDNTTLKWILNEVETILIIHGVTSFGERGGSTIFDPSKHEFIPGLGTSDPEIRVQAPGFSWKDPADNAVVLVRARVTRK